MISICLEKARHSYERIGLLATAILKMNGIAGLAGWRWIFVNKSLSLVQPWPILDHH